MARSTSAPISGGALLSSSRRSASVSWRSASAHRVSPGSEGGAEMLTGTFPSSRSPAAHNPQSRCRHRTSNRSTDLMEPVRSAFDPARMLASNASPARIPSRSPHGLARAPTAALRRHLSAIRMTSAAQPGGMTGTRPIAAQTKKRRPMVMEASRSAGKRVRRGPYPFPCSIRHGRRLAAEVLQCKRTDFLGGTGSGARGDLRKAVRRDRWSGLDP